MLYELIPSKEKLMIEDYIKSYAAKDDCQTLSDIDLPAVLQYWNKEKENLYELLGKNFIVEKPVHFSIGEDETTRRIIEDDTVFRYLDNLKSKFRSYISNLAIEEDGMIQNADYATWNLFSPYTLGGKTWKSDELVLRNSRGPFLTVKKGMKMTKILRSVSRLVGEDEQEFERFRIAHSMLLNDKQVDGTLCLSIHPLDYMTMSDNYENWSSCMSWTQWGGYRAGTVEMMNSPLVVVAYLKSDNGDFRFENYSWSNKKWRCLYLVSKDYVTSVKDYPYHNENLEIIAAKELVRLARENWGSDMEEEDVKMRGDALLKCGNNSHFRFRCEGRMYCDMGCAESYAGTVSPSFQENASYDKSYFVDYSGVCNCMRCGQIRRDYGDEDEWALTCEECEDRCRCCNCGESLNPDYAYYDDFGDCYCEDCYYELFTYDPWSGGYVSKEDLEAIVVTMDEEFYVNLAASCKTEYEKSAIRRFYEHNGQYEIEMFLTPDMIRSIDRGECSKYIDLGDEEFDGYEVPITALTQKFLTRFGDESPELVPYALSTVLGIMYDN